MKVTIGVIVLLLIIIGTALGLYFYSGNLYSDLQKSLDIIEKAAQEDNWELAEKEAANLQDMWDKGDVLWSAVMDHSQVDRVDESITMVIATVEHQLKDELLVELRMATRLLSRLQDSESPHFRNVF